MMEDRDGPYRTALREEITRLRSENSAALDALRKIALGHPCDLPVNIARVALQKMGARP